MQKLIFFFLCLGVANVFGLSLAQKQKWKEANEQVQSNQKDFKERCGTDVSFSFEIETFSKWNWERRSPANSCSNIFRSMGYICQNSPEGKKAVQNAVKKVTCSQRADGAPEHHVLSGGTLKYTVEADSSNSQDEAWLKRNLKGEAKTDLVEAEGWATAQRTLDEYLKTLNTKCETNIVLEFNKKSFNAEYGKHPHPTVCDKPIDNLTRLCEEDQWRVKIAKSVKKIHCKGHPTLDNSRYIDLKNGTLTFEVGINYPNDSQKEEGWLKAKL